MCNSPIVIRVGRVFSCLVLAVMVAACGKSGTGTPATTPDAEAKLSVPGMHCSSCVGTIRGGLREVPGVASSTFDLEKKEVTVRWDSKSTDQAAIEAAITKAGFEVKKPGGTQP